MLMSLPKLITRTLPPTLLPHYHQHCIQITLEQKCHSYGGHEFVCATELQTTHKPNTLAKNCMEKSVNLRSNTRYCWPLILVFFFVRVVFFRRFLLLLLSCWWLGIVDFLAFCYYSWYGLRFMYMYDELRIETIPLDCKYKTLAWFIIMHRTLATLFNMKLSIFRSNW